MNHLEIEYKTLLNESEFKQLKKLFHSVKATTQTNYYLESETYDIRKNKMSLRIRTFSDRAELTLKIPQQVGNMEYNINLTLTEAETILLTKALPQNNIFDLLLAKGIDVSRLIVLGHLTTVRREMKTPIGLMALDENHYGNHHDFELELEVDQAKKGKEDFKHFLEENKIAFKYAKSKVVRFINSINKSE